LLEEKRQPLYPVAKLKNHKDCVNAVAWAPLSWYNYKLITFSTHICSVADDSVALIWDLSDLQNKTEKNETNYDPLLEYKAESEISNLTWSLNDLLGICYANTFQVLNV
jgi:WD repeat-containing protein 68